MQQYLKLLKTVKDQGTYKPPAREGMPGSTSLFGYQFRHNLSQGFPLLTTKKMYWKGIVTELLWFLRGDTNIKYLIDNGVNIWNEDAYNFYMKKCKEYGAEPYFTLETFIDAVRTENFDYDAEIMGIPNEDYYRLGDCGFQYGRVWRSWETMNLSKAEELGLGIVQGFPIQIDQIANVIKSLKTNPESRRHIVTAIDPGHDQDLALYWCHAMFQFNCRPLSSWERHEINGTMYDDYKGDKNITDVQLDELGVPKYYLDCQLYQRSADTILGVPFNIACYALLTHIIAKICNMVPGEFIHTFGDVHIYDNHMDAVNEQLSRTPTALPSIQLFERSKDGGSLPDHFEKYLTGRYSFDDFIQELNYQDFQLIGYNPQGKIKAELSTGLKK